MAFTSGRNAASGKWPVKNIVLFNPGNRNFNQGELSDVVRPRGWRISKISSSLPEVFQEISQGRASFLVIDDTYEYPAVMALRGQLFNVHALLTPTIVLWNPTSNEEKFFIQRHGLIETLNKPFSPLGFGSSFDKVLARYNNAPFSVIRSAFEAVVSADMARAFSLLMNLSKLSPTAGVACSVIALFHLAAGRFSHAEKTLLNGLSLSSHSVALTFHLIHHSLSLGLPLRALTYIDQLNEQYANPHIVNVDAMQAYLMLNDIRMAIGACRNMVLKGFMAEEARRYLPRLLFSGGFRDEFDAAINYKPAKFMLFDKAWYGLDDEAAEQRRKLYEKNLVLHGQRRLGDAKAMYPPLQKGG